MKPIGPLMREHRLIERMVRLMERDLGGISGGKEANPLVIGSAVGFSRPMPTGHTTARKRTSSSGNSPGSGLRPALPCIDITLFARARG